MKKQTHPIHAAMVMVFVIVLVCASITAMVKADHYSPMQSHIDYLKAKHFDSCKYKVGECPQAECSHSAIQ